MTGELCFLAFGVRDRGGKIKPHVAIGSDLISRGDRRRSRRNLKKR